MRFSYLWRDHDGLVFPSTVGTPLYHRNLSRAFFQPPEIAYG